ncbi:MAG TPA: 50S ribosomal protein L2 [Dehalococcoidales bacterium]|nr:50S ribosomal protein L2 [Dehalococcoidales bacterium]
MAIVKFKPTSPGRRNQSGYTFDEITKGEPEKALVGIRKKAAGRNHRGVVTIRRQAGGVKQLLRKIDFKRDKTGVPGKISAIEYDPNRTARIALVYYADGDKRYILAPQDLKVGDAVKSGEDAEVKAGNHMPLKNIPSGTAIHNIEMQKGKGGQLVRSAGGVARLMVKEGDHALIRLPSSELRKISVECCATIGQLGNIEHSNISLGKAGRRRLLGWRPRSRGTAKTPRDHPHGGGSGKCPVGMPGPKTPWGKPTLGFKTRKKKSSDKLIVRRREK